MATRKILHIRRCHVCGTVTEREDHPVERCTECGKHLAPFFFFAGEDLEKGISDQGLEMSLWKEAIGYSPLWGIAIPWTEE